METTWRTYRKCTSKPQGRTTFKSAQRGTHVNSRTATREALVITQQAHLVSGVLVNDEEGVAGVLLHHIRAGSDSCHRLLENCSGETADHLASIRCRAIRFRMGRHSLADVANDGVRHLERVQMTTFRKHAVGAFHDVRSAVPEARNSGVGHRLDGVANETRAG